MQKVRNHVARALWDGRFKPRKVKNRKTYSRKAKHKKDHCD